MEVRRLLLSRVSQVSSVGHFSIVRRFSGLFHGTPQQRSTTTTPYATYRPVQHILQATSQSLRTSLPPSDLVLRDTIRAHVGHKGGLAKHLQPRGKRAAWVNVGMHHLQVDILGSGGSLPVEDAVERHG